MADDPAIPHSKSRRLRELALLFTKLGLIGFGGPAVHIALMEDEVVVKRQWLTREQFLDLVGATNLIPGPNSTEMTMHIGLVRAGFAGLVVSGLCFILPAAVITGLFAWLYVRYGAMPAVQPLLMGVKPAVIAVMLVVIARLALTAVRDARLVLVGVAALVASLYGENELIVLFGGAALGMVWLRLGKGPQLPFTRRAELIAGPLLWLSGAAHKAQAQATTSPEAGAFFSATAPAASAGVSLAAIFLYFLKIGSVLYGSGYVLVAFLEGGVVEERGWMTRGQLLDAISVGQFTPGPLFSTATFVGYFADAKSGGSGLAGAAVATVGIFLPSFVFVAALGWVMRWLKDSAWMRAFLDTVNVVALALMLAVAIKLGREVLWTGEVATSWVAWVILVAGGVAAWFRMNAAAVIVGGAVVGWAVLR
jgi:chromate transporter